MVSTEDTNKKNYHCMANDEYNDDGNDNTDDD